MRTGLMAAVVGLAGSLALGSGARAASDNAALEYYKAWVGQWSGLQDTLITGGDTFELADGAVETLTNHQFDVLRMLEATKHGEPDWGIRYEDGFEAEMPHLGSMRGSSKVLASDTLRCLEQGDYDGAAERVAALHRIGVHSASGDTLIGSLVGIAIGNLGVELTNQMINDGIINREGARTILDAIQADSTSDRYRMRDAIFGEWRMMSEYIVKHAPEKNAGAWLIEETMIGDQSEPEKKIQRMDRSELMRELGGFAEYHADLLSAWDAQSESKLERAEKKVQSGAYGTLTQVMGATLLRSFTSHQTTSKQLAQLIERLEEIAD